MPCRMVGVAESILGFGIGIEGTNLSPISLQLISWYGGWRDVGASDAARGARVGHTAGAGLTNGRPAALSRAPRAKASFELTGLLTSIAVGHP